MSCQLCTQGFTFDLTWTGKHWTVEEIGKCKCYGGTSEPRAEIVRLAMSSGRHVNKILLETLLRNLEYQLTTGDQQSESGVNNALAEYRDDVSAPRLDYRDKELDEMREAWLEQPVAPAKEEAGTEAPIKAGVPMADGFVPDVDGVPF